MFKYEHVTYNILPCFAYGGCACILFPRVYSVTWFMHIFYHDKTWKELRRAKSYMFSTLHNVLTHTHITCIESCTFKGAVSICNTWKNSNISAHPSIIGVCATRGPLCSKFLVLLKSLDVAFYMIHLFLFFLVCVDTAKLALVRRLPWKVREATIHLFLGKMTLWLA